MRNTIKVAPAKGGFAIMCPTARIARAIRGRLPGSKVHPNRHRIVVVLSSMSERSDVDRAVKEASQ
jgi:hypothetical protein